MRCFIVIASYSYLPACLCVCRLMRESLQRAKPFDMVFLDCEMPVMDGPTTVRELRAMGFTGPIIGMTGGWVRISAQTDSTEDFP